MKQIVIIGCGVIGAMIAYEISQIPNLQITVLDRQPPAQAATGAALGVLMGVISQKTKGRAWAMRQASIQRYNTLLPELAALTGNSLTWNQQGILKLCFAEDDRSRWQALIDLRQQQGWQLEYWQPEHIWERCPQIQHSDITGAIYSPQDLQIDPTALTLALVTASQQRGVTFQFGVDVLKLKRSSATKQTSDCLHTTCLHTTCLHTTAGEVPADAVIIAAGLGSTPLIAPLIKSGGQPVDVHPVLGQAIQVQLQQPLGEPCFQPVITGQDIHLVPLVDPELSHTYWVGATVEFVDSLSIEPDAARLETLWQDAIAFCPALKNAAVLKTWSGLRPRPQNRPAPIVEPLVGFTNVLIATGHYRNGVLLAPATAQIVRSLLSERI